MENTFYRTRLTQDASMEFSVRIQTFEDTLKDDVKELSLTIWGENIPQLDTCFNKQELDSLIKYLVDCRDYINEHNKISVNLKTQ